MYYRGCWHIVSRGLFIGYRHARFSTSHSSPIKELYIPKYFVVHAALLGQGFPHCRKFPTAASRRSLGRLSVPMWPFNLSVRLRIIVLRAGYPRVTHPFATKHRGASFDLHVLGTPPAFILSQDQTLHKFMFCLLIALLFIS